MIVSNHSSWLDIPAINCVGPVSYVAKHEIASWPFFGLLAQTSTHDIYRPFAPPTLPAQSPAKWAERLANGDKMVLFAEGDKQRWQPRIAI